MTEPVKPRAAISVTRKVNLGNYESADVFMSISDITADTTEAEIEEVIETQSQAYEIIRRQVKAKAAELKEAAKGKDF